MSDAIFVLNAGSSSLKFSVYGLADRDLNVVAHGEIEGLGASAHFKAKDGRGRTLADVSLGDSTSSFGHAEAFAHLAHWAYENFANELVPLAVGHRVVHGGLTFRTPTLIDAAVVTRLEQLIPLAPLHQPHNLVAIKAVMRLWPDLPQVACFDTGFHRGRARVTERFGLPDELFRRGARRWGFHGLSYEYIAGRLRRLAPDLSGGRVIVAHLGNGASLCAMRDGQSVDTTMSFSALDGLPMGTRCGTLDPSVILFLLRDGWSVDRIEDLLYKRSGLLGISGVSNDVRALLASDCPLAAEAIEFFVYCVIREIGSLTAALGSLDALVFTAGIGENSPLIRRQVCQGLTWLGVRIDSDANQRGNVCISPEGCTPSVWVIPTDEEAVIASHTLAVVRSSSAHARWRTRAPAGAPSVTLPLRPTDRLVPSGPQVLAGECLTRRIAEADVSGTLPALEPCGPVDDVVLRKTMESER
jgi:acetate kinase